MTDNKEIEELRRTTVEYIPDERTEEEPFDSLKGDVKAMLDSMEAGERSKMLGVRDETTAALLNALEERENGLTAFGSALADTLDRQPPDECDRSEALRLIIRVGLKNGAPRYYEELNEAVVEHASDTF